MPVLQIRDDAFTMTTLLRWQTEHRLLPLVLAASLVVMMACIAGVLWAPVSPGSAPLQPLSEARQAYQQVVVDISTRADLARLGFGENKGARALAGLGVQEYFMPPTSEQFDHLDPAIQSCFQNEDRCTALVVPLAGPGGGFLAAHAATPAGRAVFLLRSGRVIFKQLVEG